MSLEGFFYYLDILQNVLGMQSEYLRKMYSLRSPCKREQYSKSYVVRIQTTPKQQTYILTSKEIPLNLMYSTSEDMVLVLAREKSLYFLGHFKKPKIHSHMSSPNMQM